MMLFQFVKYIHELIRNVRNSSVKHIMKRYINIMDTEGGKFSIICYDVLETVITSYYAVHIMDCSK